MLRISEWSQWRYEKIETLRLETFKKLEPLLRGTFSSFLYKNVLCEPWRFCIKGEA